VNAPRLFVTAPLGPGALVALDAGQARYLGAVMRRAAGDEVRLFNGQDGEWLARLETITKAGGRAVCNVLLRAQTTTPGLALAFAPIKGDRGDMVIEKAVDLGATRLIPVITARTIVRKPNLERWRARAIEAAEQCERLEAPPVEAPLDLDRFLAARTGGALLFCDEAATGSAPGPALPAGEITVLIGPEGGFAPDERAAILAAPGVRVMSLGPRILRADTAACAALVLAGAAPAARLRRLAHG
jgi:16S rRNA (uracil1498-N3)-methyltransferase